MITQQDVYFNANRQYLISMIRYISKPLPKSMLQILQRLEDLQLNDIPIDIRNSFLDYDKIYRSRKNEWPGAGYGIDCLYDLIYYYPTEGGFQYWIDSYIKATQKVYVIAQTRYQEYLKIQKMNIFGPQGPFNMNFVSPNVYNAALDIHVKRHWKELPMFSDICCDFGLQDNTVIEYLRNTELHKNLRVHCWIIELILKTEINQDAKNEDSFTQQWLGW